jgi:hypothetical protein
MSDMAAALDSGTATASTPWGRGGPPGGTGGAPSSIFHDSGRSSSYRLGGASTAATSPHVDAIPVPPWADSGTPRWGRLSNGSLGHRLSGGPQSVTMGSGGGVGGGSATPQLKRLGSLDIYPRLSAGSTGSGPPSHGQVQQHAPASPQHLSQYRPTPAGQYTRPGHHPHHHHRQHLVTKEAISLSQVLAEEDEELQWRRRGAAPTHLPKHLEALNVQRSVASEMIWATAGRRHSASGRDGLRSSVSYVAPGAQLQPEPSGRLTGSSAVAAAAAARPSPSTLQDAMAEASLAEFANMAHERALHAWVASRPRLRKSQANSPAASPTPSLARLQRSTAAISGTSPGGAASNTGAVAGEAAGTPAAISRQGSITHVTHLALPSRTASVTAVPSPQSSTAVHAGTPSRYASTITDQAPSTTTSSLVGAKSERGTKSERAGAPAWENPLYSPAAGASLSTLSSNSNSDRQRFWQVLGPAGPSQGATTAAAAGPLMPSGASLSQAPGIAAFGVLPGGAKYRHPPLAVLAASGTDDLSGSSAGLATPGGHTPVTAECDPHMQQSHTSEGDDLTPTATKPRQFHRELKASILSAAAAKAHELDSPEPAAVATTEQGDINYSAAAAEGSSSVRQSPQAAASAVRAGRFMLQAPATGAAAAAAAAVSTGVSDIGASDSNGRVMVTEEDGEDYLTLHIPQAESLLSQLSSHSSALRIGSGTSTSTNVASTIAQLVNSGPLPTSPPHQTPRTRLKPGPSVPSTPTAGSTQKQVHDSNTAQGQMAVQVEEGQACTQEQECPNPTDSGRPHKQEQSTTSANSQQSTDPGQQEHHSVVVASQEAQARVRANTSVAAAAAAALAAVAADECDPGTGGHIHAMRSHPPPLPTSGKSLSMSVAQPSSSVHGDEISMMPDHMDGQITGGERRWPRSMSSSVPDPAALSLARSLASGQISMGRGRGGAAPGMRRGFQSLVERSDPPHETLHEDEGEGGSAVSPADSATAAVTTSGAASASVRGSQQSGERVTGESRDSPSANAIEQADGHTQEYAVPNPPAVPDAVQSTPTAVNHGSNADVTEGEVTLEAVQADLSAVRTSTRRSPTKSKSIGGDSSHRHRASAPDMVLDPEISMDEEPRPSRMSAYQRNSRSMGERQASARYKGGGDVPHEGPPGSTGADPWGLYDPGVDVQRPSAGRASSGRERTSLYSQGGVVLPPGTLRPLQIPPAVGKAWTPRLNPKQVGRLPSMMPMGERLMAYGVVSLPDEVCVWIGMG